MSVDANSNHPLSNGTYDWEETPPRVEVWAATRGDGCVGYFKTRAEIPPEFKHPGRENIAHVMYSMNLDVNRCLQVMNQHWRQ